MALARLKSLVKSSQIGMAKGAGISRQLLNTLSSVRKNMRTRNFEALDDGDLAKLFELIDLHFFDGSILPTLHDNGHTLRFRVSRRMTNSGGITTTRFPNGNHGKLDFEIAISSTLLFESFRDDKPITVTGLICGDRLHALKRIMEHEMLHLVEMLIWKNSNCSGGRFQDIARRLFSHKQSTHQLITPADTAAIKYHIAPGDWVNFFANGRRRIGFVNRITKRATVLVPSKQGTRYTDGKRYEKYYVPIERLMKAA